mmetsp:Transcript_81943/g.240552  ORF Transcript_81943/g.240552 Transcript_81943/m.240552 type:complete len:272 (-) Transcript_81943:61-876(-)
MSSAGPASARAMSSAARPGMRPRTGRFTSRWCFGKRTWPEKCPLTFTCGPSSTASSSTASSSSSLASSGPPADGRLEDWARDAAGPVLSSLECRPMASCTPCSKVMEPLLTKRLSGPVLSSSLIASFSLMRLLRWSMTSWRRASLASASTSRAASAVPSGAAGWLSGWQSPVSAEKMARSSSHSFFESLSVLLGVPWWLLGVCSLATPSHSVSEASLKAARAGKIAEMGTSCWMGTATSMQWEDVATMPVKWPWIQARPTGTGRCLHSHSS